jgi:hypothetical protein
VGGGGGLKRGGVVTLGLHTCSGSGIAFSYAPHNSCLYVQESLARSEAKCGDLHSTWRSFWPLALTCPGSACSCLQLHISYCVNYCMPHSSDTVKQTWQMIPSLLLLLSVPVLLLLLLLC